jgi:hypothetical protein
VPTLNILHSGSDSMTVCDRSNLNRMYHTHLNNVRFTSSGDAGNDFFSSGDEGGYVPSGLTREQYEAIKKKEKEKQKKMNYGAWGPRFSASDRPAGDWMVVPSLWITGFTNNPTQREAQLRNDGENSKQIANGFTKSSKIALGFLIIDFSMALSYILHKKREASLLAIMLFKIKRITFPFSIKAILKYTLLKFAITSIVVNLMNFLAERKMKRQ